jgi:NagD protein
MEKNKKSYIMDMDGVVYAESKLIEGAKEFIYTLQKNRNKFLFLTNNSRQTPLDLSKKLAILGIKVGWERIFTSAIATAMFLNKQKRRGTAYVIGDAGLYNALHDIGYHMTEFHPDYVVIGETRSYSFEMIEKACNFILEGSRFIGTNSDTTGPKELGIVPRKLGSHSANTVMIGDRMDTDIVSGIETGLETILVLSGVTAIETLKRYPYQPSRVCRSLKEVYEQEFQLKKV